MLEVNDKFRLHERSSGSRLALFSKSDIPYAPGVGDSNEGKCWDRQVVLSLGKLWSSTNVLLRLIKRRWWGYKRSFRTVHSRGDHATGRENREKLGRYSIQCRYPSTHTNLECR